MLYNVTVSIDPSIESDWVLWMQESHIPEVLQTKCFHKCVLSKVHGNEAGECTFSVLYWALNKEDYERYHLVHAPRLQAEHSARYEGKFVAFRTTMDLISELMP
ncbi:MAG: DUF4286 family protein [Crocinitomicaceae bacterium]|nr:DUF4286 family protein [Crocinitomicaceae bacterium]